MKYENIIKAQFIDRPNRFVAEVKTEKYGEIKVHVPNTGRCKEIFQPGATVYLQLSKNIKRKYPYTLYSAYKGNELIHIDSAGANRLMEEALKAGKIRGLENISEIEREKPYGSSRFDFKFIKDGKTCFMEVKGVTLEIDGVAKFPDAPTPRGARHLKELGDAAAEGYGAYACFVIQMKGVDYFTPFVQRDPIFAAAVVNAAGRGVKLLAYDTIVSPEEITLDKEIPIKLED
ncbi:MAG: DNA/RNA nuclease SfsA [Clostridiales bacterium]